MWKYEAPTKFFSYKVIKPRNSMICNHELIAQSVNYFILVKSLGLLGCNSKCSGDISPNPGPPSFTYSQNTQRPPHPLIAAAIRGCKLLKIVFKWITQCLM